MIDYESFKNIEHKIILEENNKIETNNVNNIIKAIDKINLNVKDENKINNSEEDKEDDSCDDEKDLNNNYSVNENSDDVLMNLLAQIMKDLKILYKKKMKQMKLKYLIYLRDF